MTKAIYSVNNIGHYGLGFKYYTHFTSPIRRYSDLIVHRLLYNYIEGNGAANYPLVKLEEISGIAHFGIFVKITDNLAEGLVRLRDLEGDFYVYDEKKYALIGRVSKKQFRLGDKVRVKLVRADLDKSELDF